MAKEKKKTPSWDEIGKTIGKKIEEKFKDKDFPPWKKPWLFCHPREGGGFGRLVFIIGLLFALNYAGMLTNIPSWTLVLIVIGFALMRF